MRRGPCQPSASERLTELAEILTVGLMRLRPRKSSELSRLQGESSLDFAAGQSGRGVPEILPERP
jgi:hypothetical protein